MSHPLVLGPIEPAAARKVRFWDRIARRYAADPIADLAGYEHTLKRVQELLQPTDKVLELGCGTGSTALRLATFTQSLLATDLSAEMIAIAQEKLAVQPMSNLRFAQADADDPGLGGETHDVVLAFNLLHLLGDLDTALVGVMQALRPGGLFISKTPCVGEMNPLITRLALPLARAVGKAPDVRCFTGEQLLTAIERQGLIPMAVERHGTPGKKDIRAFIVARKPQSMRG